MDKKDIFANLFFERFKSMNGKSETDRNLRNDYQSFLNFLLESDDYQRAEDFTVFDELVHRCFNTKKSKLNLPATAEDCEMITKTRGIYSISPVDVIKDDLRESLFSKNLDLLLDVQLTLDIDLVKKIYWALLMKQRSIYEAGILDISFYDELITQVIMIDARESVGFRRSSDGGLDLGVRLRNSPMNVIWDQMKSFDRLFNPSQFRYPVPEEVKVDSIIAAESFTTRLNRLRNFLYKIEYYMSDQAIPDDKRNRAVNLISVTELFLDFITVAVASGSIAIAIGSVAMGFAKIKDLSIDGNTQLTNDCVSLINIERKSQVKRLVTKLQEERIFQILKGNSK